SAMATITSAKTAPTTTTVLRVSRRRLFVAASCRTETRRRGRRVSRRSRPFEIVILQGRFVGVTGGDLEGSQGGASHDTASISTHRGGRGGGLPVPAVGGRRARPDGVSISARRQAGQGAGALDGQRQVGC